MKLFYFLVLVFVAVGLSAARDPKCLLPAVSGPCRAEFQRFFYNQETGQCELFYYGGCQGNDNNFPTKYDCKVACIDNV
ncbi:hypothetical protein PYW07_011777 [Mythimna separata]|uniref:BPTI/Kunitz inhibitor domain-containing protein n=1 Tax=Mythimna separata TaxID=271217 RepID=A0AAD8DKI6_MYTSE|nr:hypothetical protein PYW07_011777 [Mythimna separata]